MRRLAIPLLVGVGVVVLILAAPSGSDHHPRATDTPAPGATTPARPHAILVVFDEFPGDSLLGRNGRIDAARYPAFVRLAARSTWFRNAYSSYDSTTKAVPLILDGVRPHPGTSPTYRDHPNSLFSALGRAGYRTRSFEEATAICPPRFCKGARSRRPAILPNLNHGRPERFASFLRSIDQSRRPTFWMKHVLLPHGPYVYLPSGARTRAGGPDPLPGMNTVPGFYDGYLTRHNEQRYLLQLGYVDRLLGRLLNRLERTGMDRHTLLVVVADHGIAFQVGVATRRRVKPSTVQELAPVPMFVMRPGQRHGRVSDVYARTLDVAPTIAGLLHVRLRGHHDGRSAFGSAVRPRRGLAITTRDFKATVTIGGRAWEARRRAVVRRRLRQFGWGDWSRLYRGIGPNRDLIGRRVEELARTAGRAPTASLVAAHAYRDVRRSSGVVPTEVAGSLRGTRRGAKRALAVAVNGRIEAVGSTFHLVGDPVEHFAINVPESSLREGHNLVEVFEVARRGALSLLARA